MKIYIVGLMFACATVVARQTVNFVNNVAGFSVTVDRRVYWDGLPLVGTNYAAALYFGLSPATIDQLAVRFTTDFSLLSAIARFRNVTSDSVAAGSWLGGTRFLPGTVVGQELSMEVRVWDITLFPTYDDAVTGGGVHGKSAAFDYVVPERLDANGNQPNNLRAFTLVPEPSAAALWAIGAVSLLAGSCWTRRCRTKKRANASGQDQERE